MSRNACWHVDEAQAISSRQTARGRCVPELRRIRRFRARRSRDTDPVGDSRALGGAAGFRGHTVLRDRAFEPFESLLGAAQIMLSNAVRDVANGEVRTERRPRSLQASGLRSCPSLSGREEWHDDAVERRLRRMTDSRRQGPQSKVCIPLRYMFGKSKPFARRCQSSASPVRAARSASLSCRIHFRPTIGRICSASDRIA